MIPKLIPAVKLEELRLNNTDIFDHDKGSLEEWQSENRQQLAFLDAYRLCLSKNIACKRSGVSRKRFDRWKNNSYKFGLMLNNIIEDAAEELMGSVLVRATGYLKNGEDGEIETDATGKPIYYGGSDALAIALLKAGSENAETTEAKGITINLHKED